MLPKRNGLEVATELRRLGRQTPIIMLTARDASQDIRGGLAAGVNDYLGKPFRFDELVKRLEAVIVAGKALPG
jgi:two-component system response regulator MprA